MSKTRCGSKGGTSDYDPQIGAAAAQSAKTAQQAQDFAENYYKTIITPMLQQQNTASLKSQDQLNTLYGLNATQMQQSIDRYNQYGIPAENKYYDMVSQYSQPEEYERQAQSAAGDLKQAEANQATATSQQMAAAGIDPTSPAAMSAASDASVRNAAAEAGAMNRARNAARAMGMQLTSDAANFGRGGQSATTAFGSAAQGNATGSFGVANSALGTAASANATTLSGYGTALSGFNNNLDAYAKLGSANMAANAASNPWTGIGSLVGTVAGKALKF
jgi:hypothetical protein